MNVIDRFAYRSRLRGLDPMQKAVLTFGVAGLCLILDRPAVAIVAVAWMWLLAAMWAGLPVLLFAKLLLAEAAFLALSLVGIAASAGVGEPPAITWLYLMGPLWIGATPSSLSVAIVAGSRALGCAAALNLFALTTPMVDVLEISRRLRFPTVIIDLMALTYRFVFTLVDSLTRIHTAQYSRLGYATLGRSFASMGTLVSRLLIDALHRSRRLELSLASRGYTGDLRVLTPVYRRENGAWGIMLCVAATMLAVWVVS